MEPLTVILICLASLYFVAELLKLIEIPRVVSQIGVGLIMGLPFVKPLIFDQESLSIITFLGYIGSILLLFFVGIEMDLTRFRKDFSISLNVSLFNTVVPLALGFAASYWLFGLPAIVSLIIGVCMSVSATAFALDMLEEFGKLKTAIGALIISAGTVDDLLEIILITSIIAVIGTVATKFSLLTIVLNMILFLGVLFLFRFALIPLTLKVVERRMYKPALFTGALIITLLLASFAEYLKIGALMGALFAGIIIKHVLLKDAEVHKPWERSEISRTVHSVGFGFLVPFFFLWVGLSTDIASVFENLWFAIAITLITIVGTVVGSAAGYWMKVKNWRHPKKMKNGWMLGWAMNAKGDTGIVITQLAFTAGIISQGIFSSLVFMAIVATLISPLVFRQLIKE